MANSFCEAVFKAYLGLLRRKGLLPKSFKKTFRFLNNSSKAWKKLLRFPNLLLASEDSWFLSTEIPSQRSREQLQHFHFLPLLQTSHLYCVLKSSVERVNSVTKDSFVLQLKKTSSFQHTPLTQHNHFISVFHVVFLMRGHHPGFIA